MCLDPPLTIDELPEDDKWYCKACQAARRILIAEASYLYYQPKSFFSPYKGMFAELLQVLDDRNPREFQLPEDIRTFFAGSEYCTQVTDRPGLTPFLLPLVRTDPDGAYSAAVDVKPVKFE
ncbi:hypothetical protein QFC19_007122 [Naganishia cerealis]|uniref:Uncharacterized protein n=1 Tax=Naganishia cerealis TaxID=610337 RepID=A0ACC2VBW9_9TREE|nr:hypothetical protein QFC19_007122 [Naganishia cerealis]